MKSIPIILLLFLAVPGVRAAEFDLGKRGVLSIEVPEKWTANGKAAAGNDGAALGYSLAINPPGDANAKCLVTFIFSPNKQKPDRERIHKQVLGAGEEFVGGSVEQKKNLQDFSLKQGFGAYCVFTDASLVGKPSQKDNFKVIGSGLLQLNDEIMAAVTLFADEAGGKEFKAMLQAINSIQLKEAK